MITGASVGGIGAHIAVCLAAAHPALILLLGRSENKVAPVVEQIQQVSPSTKAQFIKIDLASCASVRAAAAEVKSTVTIIAVLINNAGIMGPSSLSYLRVWKASSAQITLGVSSLIS